MAHIHGPGAIAESSAASLVARPLHLLIVDDEMAIVQEVLEFFEAEAIAATGADSADAAMRAIAQNLPGTFTVVLTDLKMPGQCGLALTDELRRSTPEACAVEVVIMTAHGNFSTAKDALRLHAFDFIDKPPQMDDLLRIVGRAHDAAMNRRRRAQEATLSSARLSDLTSTSGLLTRQTGMLAAAARRRALEVAAIRATSLEALTLLASVRDNDTGEHIQRTQAYVRILIDGLKHHPRFAEQLSDQAYCEMMVKATPLHDIGKVGIPDAILLKPGPLTAAEFAVIRTHPVLGANAIAEAIRRGKADIASELSAEEAGEVSSWMEFLEVARECAVSHHEKWDGTGYPFGLVGERIPLVGRLVALADVFDALLSRRPYKDPMPVDRAVQVIMAGRGSHFDPAVVDAFLEHVQEFKELFPETDSYISDE